MMCVHRHYVHAYMHMFFVGLYRENAIAIQKESGNSNGGNVYHNANYVQHSRIYA